MSCFANSYFKFAAAQCLQGHIQPILCVGKVMMGLDNVTLFLGGVKYAQLLFPLNHDDQLTSERFYSGGKKTDQVPGNLV